MTAVWPGSLRSSPFPAILSLTRSGPSRQETRQTMFQALLNRAGRLLGELDRSFPRSRFPIPPARTPAPPPPAHYGRLTRVVLTDEVARTLFDEYAAHRAGQRGEEETGWVLLGLRETDEAVVLATLPAGAESNAGVAHVRFNCHAQAMGSRMVRQTDKRLTILGVVHTHPGTLRHPSDGDYRGDSAWVGQLRGRDGIFAIGTADEKATNGTLFARQPKPHWQCLGDMCLSWYALAAGAPAYRALPYALTLGPDLARPLHAVWSEIEAHADELDRLYRQQAGVTFEVTAGRHGPALAVHVPLAEPGGAVRVLVEGKEVFYYLQRGGEVLAADFHDDRLDRGVYLMLAELAAQAYG